MCEPAAEIKDHSAAKCQLKYLSEICKSVHSDTVVKRELRNFKKVSISIRKAR